MDLRKIAIFRMMSERMAWLTERQNVLAHNVANANTPGYQAQDLEPLKFSRVMDEQTRMHLASTSTTHMQGTHRPARYESEEDERGEELPAGNAVILEEQLMKVTDNAMQYQLTTGLYQKHVAMIRAALQNPGR